MKFSLAGMRTVFLKECRENLRDRRSVINALVYGPFLMPIIFLGQTIALAKQQHDVWEEPPTIAVQGAANAPNLVAFLEREGATITPAPADPARSVREQEEDTVLVIPAAFGKQWRGGESAAVELIYDASRRKSDSRQRRVRALLEQYSRTVGSLRLLVRGVDPVVARPLDVEGRDVSAGGIAGAILASFMPFVLMFSAFLGGFYLAVDTTAGERERQSLEPLLTNPVSRWQVVTGKLAATVAFALAATLITITVFGLCLEAAMRFGPADALGVQFDVSIVRWAGLLVLLVPVVVLASSMQTLVAAFSKTFREAQTYVQFLMFIPMVPCFMVMYNPVKPALHDMLIPFWSQTVLIDRLLRGEVIDPLLPVVSFAATCVAAALVIGQVARLYRGEKLLFTT